jgi:multidrug efflux pump subunit AcrA (membrane-fusion protein)
MRTFIVLSVSGALAAALVSCALAASPAAAPSGTPGVITVDHCIVQLNEIDGEALIPAQEAGVLTKILVRDGQQVKTGDLLANIDDAQAQKQRKNAVAAYNAANEDAKSDIDIKAATKAAQVTEDEYKSDKLTNTKVDNAVTHIELEQKLFQWEKMLLAIDQAKKKQIIDGYSAEAKQAEAELAQIAIARREIRAPMDGIIQETKFHIGEWVKPGDTVFHLFFMDRLSVEGVLNSALYNPADVTGRPVNVQVTLAGGRSVQFPGKIVFVASQIEGDGRYRVRAEVDNRQDNGQWSLRPGMSAVMAIQLK